MIYIEKSTIGSSYTYRTLWKEKRLKVSRMGSAFREHRVFLVIIRFVHSSPPFCEVGVVQGV